MQKKRILFLITRSEPGGAQSHVLELLTGLRKIFHVTLATGEQGYLLDQARGAGIDAVFLPFLKRKISLKRDVKAYREIKALMQKVQPDLVHTHSSKAGILGRLAAKILGIKNVFTAHGWAFADGTPLSRRLIGIPTEYVAAKWCDRIITVSQADKELAVKYKICREEKITVVHNGIADINPLPVAENRNKIPVLTMVARLAPQKNFIGLLDALSHIEEKYLLQIVGDGPDLEKIKRHATQLGIDKNISFMGSRSDVPEILAETDIFILSSDWEGYPISILEAMRAGLPIICTRVGGTPEAVINEKNGLLVARGNTQALASAISRLIKDTQERQEFGRNSRVLFERQGTTEIMLKKIIETYNSILE